MISDPGDLGERIRRAKGDEGKKVKGRRKDFTVLRIAHEFIVASLVGGAIGFYLDEWLSTRPIFLIIFFFLGVAAGVLNIYKLAARTNQTEKNSQ